MQTIEGKVAVVTGAALGIGHGIALALARRGAKLVLADVRKEPLEAFEAELRSNGTEVVSRIVDVGDSAAVERLAQDTVETFGRVDILCSNAGVSNIGLQWELTEDQWNRIIQVDLWGPIHGVRAFVPLMLAGGTEAHIVNTASMGGLFSAPFVGPYTVSKHAVVGLSRGLKHELEIIQAKIGVSVLCPGEIRTSMGSALRKEPLTALTEKIVTSTEEALARGMDPEAVGDLVADAIINNQFYIMPNSAHFEQALRADFNDQLRSLASAE